MTSNEPLDRAIAISDQLLAGKIDLFFGLRRLFPCLIALNFKNHEAFATLDLIYSEMCTIDLPGEKGSPQLMGLKVTYEKRLLEAVEKTVTTLKCQKNQK